MRLLAAVSLVLLIGCGANGGGGGSGGSGGGAGGSGGGAGGSGGGAGGGAGGSGGGAGGSGGGAGGSGGGAGALGGPCDDASDCPNPQTQVCSPATATCVLGECVDNTECSGTEGCFAQVADPTVGACYPLCTPFGGTTPCGAGETCVPSDTDGYCKDAGPAALGAACTRTGLSTGCAVGANCIDFTNGGVCKTLCDPDAASPGCPGPESCMPFLFCATPAEVGADPVQPGAACSDALLLCGDDGERFAGACDASLTCRSFCETADDCAAGERCGLIGGLWRLCQPAPVCGTTTDIAVTALSFRSGDAMKSIYLTDPMTPNLTGVEPDIIQLEFWDFSTGPFDLAAGPNASYAICNQCLLGVQDATLQTPSAFYFQLSGSINVGDAPNDQNVSVVLQDVVLMEATIDPDTVEATFVPGGDCLRITGPLTIATP